MRKKDRDAMKDIDFLVEYMRTLKRPEVTVLCPDQYQKMLAAARLREHCCEDAEVTVTVHPDFFLGAVKVECNDFIDIRSKDFAEAVSYSDLVEIYRLKNKKIRLELTFHRMTRPLRNEEG